MNQKIALLGPLACCALATCTDEPAVILTHVWGVRTDEMGVQYVAGLRLVRRAGQSPRPDVAASLWRIGCGGAASTLSSGS